MIRSLMVFALLALLAAPSFAAQPRGPDGRFIARPAPTLLAALAEGFELSAGFRWENSHECPTFEEPDPSLAVTDPFYLGAGFRLPLAERADWHTQFDRDFTDEARWQLRTEIVVTPWARRP